jgi:two-component system chemotaxis response regulator CheB
MPRRDLVVIGASAGGLEALRAILKRLPSSFDACVLVVMHTRADANGVLPDILERVSTLPVAFGQTGDRLTPGHTYVAPPDYHMLVTGSSLSIVHGPRENGFRPAIDPLFRTAARERGVGVIGVILSGALSDGAFGLSVIKQHGGIAIVQDPDDATIGNMPRNAMNAVDVDYVLPAAEIAAELMRLTAEAAEGDDLMARTRDLEPQLPSENTQVSEMLDRYGAPSGLTCPDCGGALWEVQEGRLVRYQCHVGHQYAVDSLDAEQRGAVDTALWSAVRVLEEQSELKMRMARRAEGNGLLNVAEGFHASARDAHAQAQQIRSVLFTAGERPERAEAADDPGLGTRPRSRPARAVSGRRNRRGPPRRKA